MIKRASFEDIHLVAPLFDLYRQFYSQESNLVAAESFLNNLVTNYESVVFFAEQNDEVVGFIQLYPSYSSITMKRCWILNDLFVLEAHRGQGLGEALIKEGLELARSTGASSVVLETAPNNPAQKLYERLGWKQSSFKLYEFTC